MSLDYLIRGPDTFRDPEHVEIKADGEATLTEALDFALAIINTVRQHGKVTVEAYDPLGRAKRGPKR